MREFIADVLASQHHHNKHIDFSSTSVSSEGFVKAVIADIGHSLHNGVSTVSGWVEGVSSKRKHINEIAEATIDWLKDEDKDNPRLDLDMGSFKNWMKTSETHLYRYYYLLSNHVYNDMISKLKNGDISELEDIFSHFVSQHTAINTLNSHDMSDRKSATRLLDSIRNIKDLIVLVTKYKARVNVVFDLIEKRERSIKGFPFQLMLSGMNDMRQTVKKIVNLAT